MSRRYRPLAGCGGMPACGQSVPAAFTWRSFLRERDVAEFLVAGSAVGSDLGKDAVKVVSATFVPAKCVVEALGVCFGLFNEVLKSSWPALHFVGAQKLGVVFAEE